MSVYRTVSEIFSVK